MILASGMEAIQKIGASYGHLFPVLEEEWDSMQPVSFLNQIGI